MSEEAGESNEHSGDPDDADRGATLDDEREAAATDESGSASADDRSETLLEETFETTDHEPGPPSFDVTSCEDLVDRLPTGSDVPSDVRKSFWGMVVLLKIALLALSLGAMLAYFRGEFAIAGGLVLLGGVAAVRLWLRIRAFGED